ncbi:hypothetical protein QEH42_gp242 [Microbacterium phage Pumpernickel]|uniref:Uncharacterized protein n=1 Tax=Microbacterium phage Pumpernickel TaxID=2885983 RepID=A0AAE9C2Z0_9CAUD|nr:hypothetical protein QEH42_gp242 [Microbacterium phage Pumpernickel]UDL15976.1 hypothetical protein SEA_PUMPERNICKEL_226 [Microbacterium phage Pumpernickel]
MAAPTIYFEYHDEEDSVSQFIFVPKTARADGSLTLPVLFSRTVTPTNPQRTYQRVAGSAQETVYGPLSAQKAAVEAAPSLNDLLPSLTLVLGDPRQKLYEEPVVVYISDAEVEEMAEELVLPRTLRDRIDRTRSSLGWKDLPKRNA